MTEPVIEVRGMRELIRRFKRYPTVLRREMKEGMDVSLMMLWEKVPPYPPEMPSSDYTGLLGRSLGSSIAGGKMGGKPDIYETKKIGQGYTGRFGTSIKYAPRVIGDKTQIKPWKGRWWTMSKIADLAKVKILKLWDGIGRDLAKFLDGKKGV